MWQHTLLAFSSSCHQVCRLARSRVFRQVRVQHASDASALQRLQLGLVTRPPFSGCEVLGVKALDMDTCSQMPGVLAAAATSMANLRTVQLTLVLPAAEDAAEPSTQEGRDTMLAGLLSPMFELQQLRRLVLNTDVLGPSTAAALAGLMQLSSLSLRHQNHGEETPGPCWDLDYSPPMVDLSHLSGLTQLVELRVCDLVEAQPPANAAGPFCLPSSLGCLEVRGNPEHWLQHLPGCPQLRELHLHGPNWSKHPADVVEIGSVQVHTCAAEAHPGE